MIASSPRLSTLLCTAVCASLALPAVSSAQRGAAGPPRDPMQEGLPLRPTRTMNFTTNVGNWMSSDVSSDGKSIAFDLLGDIYTMPITGGKATALTRGMAFDAQPRFSPDGKKIVYVSDRTGGYNLFTISVDKKDTVQITTGNTNEYESPIWTPDGKYIIATRGSKLWMFPATGGTGIQLIRDSAAAGGAGRAGGGGADVTREEGPAMSAKDPRYVYFAERRGRWIYNTPLGDYDLRQYDRETGRVTTKENRWGSAFRPTPSPDGKWLVYGTRYVDQTRLRIRNLATNEDEWLTGPVQRDDQESLATLDVYPGMSFTPDSKYLVTTWGGKFWKIAVDTKQATEIPFEADVVQAMGPHVAFDYRISDSATFTIKQIRDAVPSPDGKRLAFVALDRLYVMDYPAGTPKRLTNSNHGEFEPAWSPDGKYIAFTTWDDSIGYLNRVSSDGTGRATRLTPQEGLWTNPVYTPNGQRIVATRGPSRAFRTSGGGGGRGGGGGDLVWIPATGGASTFITSNAGDAHFSARDTSRIFAYSGQRGLYSMRWDGTDIKNIVRIAGGAAGGGGGGGRGGGAAWAQLSPDGEHALAQIGTDLYYIPDIPWPGGPEPTITVGEGRGGGGGDGAAAGGGGQAFPSRKLTDIGAQFPHWGNDNTIHWSIGNAHAVYDVARAVAFDDSVRKARGTPAVTPGDSTGDAPAGGRGGRGGRPPLPTYKPVETRIRIQAERDIPKATAVLRGARIITMKGAEVIEKGDIVVVNNHITAIGASGTVTVPAGAQVIDVSGKTISPGFVDTHAHLRLASNVHRDPVWSYAANLAYGVTAARDPQTGTTDVLSYEDQEKAGKVLSPRIYSTGPGVFAAENIRSLENARTVLKRYAEYYDTKTIKEYETGNREVRQWVIQAANELKLMPTTEGGLDYKMNMTEAIDGYSGHEHTIPTYPLQPDVIRLLKESGITYTPTIIVAYGAPWAENYWYEHTDMLHDAKLQLFTPWSDLESKILRRGGSQGPVTTKAQAGWFADNQYPMKLVGGDIKHLVDAGGSAGVGSHGQQQGVGYHWELWNIGMGDGMTPWDALKVATILGAESLGLGKDIGSLEVGKMADMVVFDRNPLENLQNTQYIKYVMKNGRLYDATNLDEVYPRKVKGAPFAWNEDESPTRDKMKTKY